jgi:hypothetical protein
MKKKYLRWLELFKEHFNFNASWVLVGSLIYAYAIVSFITEAVVLALLAVLFCLALSIVTSLVAIIHEELLNVSTVS